MAGLSSELFNETRRVLMECPPFDSNVELRDFFADPCLRPWRNRVPEASSRQSRVQAVIALLVNAANVDGDNALVLLVQALLNGADREERLYGDLCRLHAGLVAALGGSPWVAPPPATAAAPAPASQGSAPGFQPSSLTIIGDGNVVGSGSSSHVVKTGPTSLVTATPMTSSLDLPAFRAQLQRLDVVEIESLCLDYFPEVWDRLSRGLRRDEVINLLLAHCRRIPEAGARLAGLLAHHSAGTQTAELIPAPRPPETRVQDDIAPSRPLPVYRAVTVRLFERASRAGEPSDAAYPAELIVAGGRDFPRGELALDTEALLSCASDVRAYGQRLGEMLFAESALGRAYREVLAVAQSRGERLRVRLRLEAPELHDIRWERLTHPVGDTWLPIAATTDTLLSRYVPAQVWGELQSITAGAVRILVVIASPKDVGRYGLAPISEAERAAWHAVFSALPGVQVTYLESGTSEPPTFGSVRRALVQGYHIVQFVCHGVRAQDGVALALEQETGDTDLVGAGRLIEMLRGLPSQPVLCNLAACESGASDAIRGFAALGPQLVAHGGIPAVVAMAESVRLVTARQFAGQFYNRLFVHGFVDLAVHEARAEVREQLDWSVPVLFSRLPENRLW